MALWTSWLLKAVDRPPMATEGQGTIQGSTGAERRNETASHHALRGLPRLPWSCYRSNLSLCRGARESPLTLHSLLSTQRTSILAQSQPSSPREFTAFTPMTEPGATFCRVVRVSVTVMRCVGCWSRGSAVAGIGVRGSVAGGVTVMM